MSVRSLGPLARGVVVARARSAIGFGTVYKLGQGGREPAAPRPGVLVEAHYQCDCSGFVAWCLGIDRYLPNVPGVDSYPWFETSSVAKDVLRADWPDLSQIEWQAAVPGDVLVWGDHDGHQGHIGLVSSAGPAGAAAVVHCSSGNYKRVGDAIQETTAELFLRNHALVGRVAWVVA